MRFGTGDLNPHTFFYPALYFYTLFAFHVLYFVTGRLFGRFGSVGDFIAEYHVDPTVFFLIDRGLVALLGTATILVVYRAGGRLFSGRVGLVAAFFTAVSFLHVRDSHFGTTDVPLTFLLVLAFLLIARMREVPSLRRYVIAGVTVGLASAVKHSGALMLVAGWIAHALNATDERQWMKLLLDKRPWLLTVAAAAAFLASNPFAVLDWPTFLADLRLQFTELGGTILYYRSDPGWRAHATFSLFYGVGWPLLAACVVGFVIVLVTDWKKALLLGSFPIVYYVFFGRGYAVSVRYAVPLVPFVCIAAAFAWNWGSARLLGRFHARSRTVTTAAVAVFIALPTIRSSMQFGQLLATEDTRLAAARWISEHVPAGSSIYQAASPYGLIRLDRTRESLLDEIQQIEAVGGQGAGPRAKLARLERTGTLRYDEWIYDTDMGFLRVRKPIQELPDYIVVEDSPLIGYRREAERVKPLVAESYDLAVFIKGVDTNHPANKFYQQDVFYVPYTGFHAERPGPGLRIYRRRDLAASK